MYVDIIVGGGVWVALLVVGGAGCVGGMGYHSRAVKGNLLCL